MTVGYIHYYIPPGPSEDIIGVLFGEWIEPKEVLVAVPVAASFVILMSGSLYPCIKVISGLELVFAVGITVGVVVPMFGAVVGDLEPGVTIAILLFYSFIQCGTSGLGSNSWAGAYGIARLQCLL